MRLPTRPELAPHQSRLAVSLLQCNYVTAGRLFSTRLPPQGRAARGAGAAE